MQQAQSFSHQPQPLISYGFHSHLSDAVKRLEHGVLSKLDVSTVLCELQVLQQQLAYYESSIQAKDSFIKKLQESSHIQDLELVADARDIEILSLLANGSNQQEVADHIGVSVKTVQKWLKRLRDDNKCATLEELIATAFRSGALK